MPTPKLTWNDLDQEKQAFKLIRKLENLEREILAISSPTREDLDKLTRKQNQIKGDITILCLKRR